MSETLYTELLDLLAHARGDLEIDFSDERVNEGLEALRQLEVEQVVVAYPQMSGRLLLTRGRLFNYGN